jgi:hypothetical protein
MGWEMRRVPRPWIIVLVATIAGCGVSESPAQTPENRKPTLQTPAPKPQSRQDLPKQEHGFWDKKNIWLFLGVGATRTLDYFSTLNMRRRGNQEIFLTNEAVDNHAAFAAIEAAGTGVSIGASYLFHRFGHHKLEQWTSTVHFTLAATGAVRNYCLKTEHPATPSHYR